MKSSGSGLIVCLPSLSTHEKRAMTDRVDGSLAKKGAPRGTCDFPCWLQRAEPVHSLSIPSPNIGEPSAHG